MYYRALLLYLFFLLFLRRVFKAIASIEADVIVQLDDLICCFLELISRVFVLDCIKFIKLLVVDNNFVVVKLLFLLWLHYNRIRNLTHILVR